MKERSSASMLGPIYFGNGITIGLLGSLISFLSWPAAVLLGIVLVKYLPVSFGRRFGLYRMFLSTSFGIFIGGIPLWFILGSAWPLDSSWKCILYPLTTAALFFSSVALTRFYFFCHNKLKKNDDLGQPPANNGIWRRFLLSFKLKQKNDNGQLLQSAIHSIA